MLRYYVVLSEKTGKYLVCDRITGEVVQEFYSYQKADTACAKLNGHID